MWPFRQSLFVLLSHFFLTRCAWLRPPLSSLSFCAPSCSQRNLQQHRPHNQPLRFVTSICCRFFSCPSLAATDFFLLFFPRFPCCLSPQPAPNAAPRPAPSAAGGAAPLKPTRKPIAL